MSNVGSIEAEAALIQAEVIRDEMFDRAMAIIGRLCDEAAALRSAAREARSVEAWEDVQRRAASLSNIAGYFLLRAQKTRDAEWAVREAHNVWDLSDGMGDREVNLERVAEASADFACGRCWRTDVDLNILPAGSEYAQVCADCYDDWFRGAR